MVMEKILYLLVVAVAGHQHQHLYKFPKSAADDIMPVPTKLICTNEHDQERDDIIDQSICGEPKEVYEYLKNNAAHEQVSPRAVWVKRCVGLCDYDNDGTCGPTETRTRYVPIRIYNLKTDKESCTSYPITEHVSCGCCAQSPESCAARRVFYPRKFAIATQV